nr:hypothetical protein [Tanacetum cinerariifolium]
VYRVKKSTGNPHGKG